MQKVKTFLVSSTHNWIEQFNFTDTPVEVQESAYGHYSAKGDLGCSKSYETVGEAVRELFRCAGCTITSYREV